MGDFSQSDEVGSQFVTFCFAANRQDQKKDPQQLKSETNENWMTRRMLESAAAAAAASMHFL